MIRADRPRFHPGQQVIAGGPGRASRRFTVQAARRQVYGNGRAEWHYVLAAAGSGRTILPEGSLSPTRGV